MEGSMRKALIIIGVLSIIGFQVAMSLSIAGGWVAPYAPWIEGLGAVSAVVLLVSTIAFILTFRRS
jgi:hypothetical protein